MLKIRLRLVAAVALAGVLPAFLAAQDDGSDKPLGDVARTLRKKTPSSQEIIDNDNISKVMDEVQSRRQSGSSLQYSMDGAGKGFQVSSPDVTCSLSFSANAKALLSSQYAQLELPASELLKLTGPAVVEGDSLQVSVFNGTDWHVSEVAVALTIVKRTGAPDEALYYGTARLVPAVAATSPQESENSQKRSDMTVLYRMRAAAVPSETTIFRAPLNVEIGADQEWHWAIVQAKGYPPQQRPSEVGSQAPVPAQPRTLPVQEPPQASLSAPSQPNRGTTVH